MVSSVVPPRHRPRLNGDQVIKPMPKKTKKTKLGMLNQLMWTSLDNSSPHRSCCIFPPCRPLPCPCGTSDTRTAPRWASSCWGPSREDKEWQENIMGSPPASAPPYLVLGDGEGLVDLYGRPARGSPVQHRALVHKVTHGLDNLCGKNRAN